MKCVPLLKMQWSSLFGLLSIAFLSLFLGSMTVSAVDDTSGSGEDSIAISPALQRFEVKAGGSVSEELTVINNGQTETEFIVYSRPYSVKNEQYQPQFEKTSANTDLYQWVRFNKTSYTLGPGERVVIPYSIGVPAKAAPGGHYGVIFVETQPAQDTNESVVRKKRIGSIILANVDGDITRQGELISTHVDFWQTTPPLTASNRVENTGNTDFQAHITTVVKDMFGSVKHNQTKDYIIYPGTIRNITFEWNQASWFGLFRVEQTVKVLDDSTNASHLVLMLPRWLLVVVIALIVVGAGYGLLRRKRR